MATLIVPIADVSSNALPGAAVLARLCDVSGRPLTGFTTSGGLVVEPERVLADASGIATFDLIPNSEIVPDNTFYSIKVAHYSPVIIKKTGATQYLLDAISSGPAPLGPAATLNSLGDVDTDAALPGDVLRLNVAGTDWEPYTLPSGSVPSYVHTQGAPATTWTVNHGLGRHPVIAVLDSSHREMWAQVDHLSNMQAQVTLLQPLSGSAECR